MANTGDHGPQRRLTDHVHPGYWTQEQQHRYEDKVSREVGELRKDFREEADGFRTELGRMNNRLLLLLGGLGVVAFVLPIAAPFIRAAIGFPGP